MKKIFLSVIISIMSLNLWSQQTIVVDGQITNNGGNSITVTIEFLDSLQRQIYTVLSDTSGYYIDTFSVTLSGPAMIGYATASIVDCNSKIVHTTATYSINIAALTLNLNYCGINPPAPCQAAFSRSQARDSSRNLIPGHVIITDMSTGSNLQYLWDFGDGSTSTLKNPSHTYTGNGPYVLCLTVTDSNCTSTFCDSLTVDSNGIVMKGSPGFTIHVGSITTGINKVRETKFTISPNPVENQINIQFTSALNQQMEMSIINVNGQVHQRKKIDVVEQQTVQIDVSTLGKGIYLLYIQSESGVFTERFIKK